MQTLLERLEAYRDSDYYGFHMPGHKRNPDMLEEILPCGIDITEIDGFDDLHHADGILKEAQELAARVYGAEETHFLVNGSTAGILSAILGVTKRGDRILVARNCHKSVYHAIEMNGLEPVYLYPEFDPNTQLNMEISAEDVRDTLAREPGIRAVVVVSPTYDGVVSDVEMIAEAVHAYGLPLIVDEAHGAHFGFHPYFPDNANMKGADVVIHSLHKTLPSLTQTALLHLNGDLANRRGIRRYLHMLQTSSPSYILMASMDSCVHQLAEHRKELFDPYVRRLQKVRESLGGLRRLSLSETKNMDPSKLVISAGTSGLTGRELYQILLKEYHIQTEMQAGTYVLAMTSVGDTDAGFERLIQALAEIDRGTAGDAQRTALPPGAGKLPRAEQIYSPYCAVKLRESAEPGQVRWLPWAECAGTVALEYAYLYPPGCPLIVPGEKISQEAADVLQWYNRNGFSVEGVEREAGIEVWVHG